MMKVINFFESERPEYWLGEIGKSEWKAGAFLKRILSDGSFFDLVGEGSVVLLLTDGEELISYCTFSKYDDIQPTDLTPWVGFVYTFQKHRGHRYAGLLFKEAEKRAKEAGFSKFYLSTNHIGLYEKYGFNYLTQMNDIDGEPSRVYVKMVKNDFIAYCGLDCETCEARLATVRNDDELRIKVAKEWSELNNVEITSEMINCVGCRVDGAHTPFCDSLCPIRLCALSKGVETCGCCSELEICEKIKMITGNNEDALRNLKG